MKNIAKFKVGSNAFFKDIEGFVSHDCDILYIMDEWDLNGFSMFIKKKDTDMFLYPNKGLELIDDCIKQNDPITAGKFLVPEFCEYIGATINDIKRLEHLFLSLDNKHKYETYIYKCYVDNNGFWLTKTQLRNAFEIYKKYRD